MFTNSEIITIQIRKKKTSISEIVDLQFFPTIHFKSYLITFTLSSIILIVYIVYTSYHRIVYLFQVFFCERIK